MGFERGKDHQYRHTNQNPFAVINNNHTMRNDGDGPYGLVDLAQAIFLYGEGQIASNEAHQRASSVSSGMRPPPLNIFTPQGSVSSGMRVPPTLNIFPSQPMYAVDPSTFTNKITTGLASSSSSGSRRPSDTQNDAPQSSNAIKLVQIDQGSKKRPLTESDQGLPKTPDPKALRRLVQNREAARKSRLRKKAYIQQLELSKAKLTQLEQERSNAQGVINLGGGGGDVLGADQGVSLGTSNIVSDAKAFDMGYARWLEDYHRQMSELQAAVQERLPENELRIYVDNCITCIDELMYMKRIVVKSDVLHIINGTWKTPVERLFMWIGGFRPSELIEIFASQIEPSREQYMAICEVQQATHLTEEALSQGFDAQNQSLNSTISFNALSSPANVNNYMAQMADGITKLAAFENFVLQADDLRHQTIHHVLDKLLTTHQAARALIAVAEHFHRVRCLSSLWATRPREN